MGAWFVPHTVDWEGVGTVFTHEMVRNGDETSRPLLSASPLPPPPPPPRPHPLHGG
eukprot:COSAG02_NODE_22090_length_763_cov_2.045181_1_plen_55_part_01